MYCEASDVRERLDITSTNHDAKITEYIEVASDWIDKHCKYYGVTRPFAIDDDTTRYFGHDCIDGQVLHTDQPFVDVTSIANGDGVVIPSSAYRLMPRNHPRFYQIRLNTTHLWSFNDADSEIAIVGKFGYSVDVPLAVSEACSYYAGWLHQRYLAGLNQTSQQNELGTIKTVTNVPTFCRELLAPYVNHRKVF